MAMTTVTTGRIAEPELRHTGQGKPVLELRIAATRRAKDKQTDEWSDDGAPLWVSATFWDAEAERLAASLGKGDQVTVSGDVVLEEYQKRDGGQGQKMVIRFPRFLGVIPKQAPQQAPQFGQGSYAQPTTDVWSTGGTQSDVAPF